PATYRHTQHYGTLKLSPFFVLLLPPPPTSTLFPYTTLFRSSLPQSDLPRIQAQIAKSKGLNITMNVHDAGGAADITVPVNFVGNAVAGSTGTIELRATYANPDLALVPGQLVDITVGLAEIQNATVVPREAV